MLNEKNTATDTTTTATAATAATTAAGTAAATTAQADSTQTTSVLGSTGNSVEENKVTSNDTVTKDKETTEEVDKEANKEVDKEANKEVNKTENKEAVIDKDYNKLKLPDGINADQKLLEDFKKFAGENNLDVKVAQKLVDMQTASIKKQNESILASLRKESEDNLIAAKKKFGADYEANVSMARKALDKYDVTGKMREILGNSPLGNNEVAIAMFAQIGKDIVAEDKSVNAGSRSVDAKITNYNDKFDADAYAVFGKK